MRTVNGSIGEIKFGEIELGVRREELNKFGMPFDPELTADGLISDCGNFYSPQSTPGTQR